MPTLVEELNAALDRGAFVTIGTQYRLTKVEAKHRTAWRNHGHEFFKAGPQGETLMIEGQSQGKPRYACIGMKTGPLVRIRIVEGGK